MESIKTVDEYGTIRYRNKNGDLHREDGPAFESLNGYKEWCINGKWYKENGPARIWSDDAVEYWLNGKWYSKEDLSI